MKPGTFAPGRILLALLIIVLTIGLVSWGQQQHGTRADRNTTDTIPKKNSDNKKIRDLDDVLDELNGVDLQNELQKAKEEMEKVFKSFDADKIKLDIEKSMKDINFENLRKEIESSMASIDMSKVKEEMEKALKGFDAEKWQSELKKELSELRLDELKAGMDKLKELDMKKLQEGMEKLKVEMNGLGPQLEKELLKAKDELARAKAEFEEYRDFVNSLDNDGLIDKKKGYTLKHKDGELIINGQKASAETYNKYKPFLDKHKKFDIKKSDDDFSIERN